LSLAETAIATGWRQDAQAFGSVVCVSTADFNAPLWTNKQHLMSRLATELPVLYVESLGLRHPRPTRRDAIRVARRLRAGTGNPPTSSIRGLELASPLVLPWHGSIALRAVNRKLLARQLGARIEKLPEPRLLWTYSPVVVDELDLSQFATVVYHVVDDLASIPGVPAAVAGLEKRLSQRADAVVASADLLATRLSRFNPNTHLVGNAADIEHFRSALGDLEEPEDLAGMERPRAIFVGALSDHKVDWNLYREVALLLPEWSFLVVGPRGEETAGAGWRKLAGLSNCHILGARSYGLLPSYLAASDVGLIPYRLTDHTAGIWPLKLVEYLAAGLSVVTTPLDALRAGDTLPLTLAGDASSFAAAIQAADRSPTARRERSASVSGRSWEGLLGQIFEALRHEAVAG
jgi:glycosyltransferase involved in cell wall biosynthesis